jgi:hypothetical protein
VNSSVAATIERRRYRLAPFLSTPICDMSVTVAGYGAMGMPAPIPPAASQAAVRCRARCLEVVGARKKIKNIVKGSRRYVIVFGNANAVPDCDFPDAEGVGRFLCRSSDVETFAIFCTDLTIRKGPQC